MRKPWPVRLAEDIRNQEENGNLQAVIVLAGTGFDIPTFRMTFSRQFPKTPIIGTTSCLGAGTDSGFFKAPSVTALAFYGDGFSFGTAFVNRGVGDSRSDGRSLASKALTDAGIAANSVRFALLFYSYGDEPFLVDGIYDVLPRSMPILGGGAADNEMSGDWYVWNQRSHGQTSAVLAVCDWPWELSAHFESGYLVSGPSGRATSVENGRILKTIDDRPAAEVYNEWVKGAIGEKLRGGSILNETTLTPLGIGKKGDGGFKSFLLIHPEEVLPDGSMKLFASVDEGEELHLMFT